MIRKHVDVVAVGVLLLGLAVYSSVGRHAELVFAAHEFDMYPTVRVPAVDVVVPKIPHFRVATHRTPPPPPE